jgi:CheY-like chemotaxis protein
MRVIVLEDDSIQADAIRESLEENFAGIAVSLVPTEAQFHETMTEIARNPPDLLILDVMVRWTHPSPEMPPRPPEVVAEGFRRAGLRCLRLLLAAEETKDIPVILYTVLSRSDLERELLDLPPHVLFLEKESDLDRLVLHIRSMLENLPQTGPSSMAARLWSSLDAKPGWLGFSVDLKRLLRSGRGRKGDLD